MRGNKEKGFFFLSFSGVEQEKKIISADPGKGCMNSLVN